MALVAGLNSVSVRNRSVQDLGPQNSGAAVQRAVVDRRAVVDQRLGLEFHRRGDCLVSLDSVTNEMRPFVNGSVNHL